MVLTGADLRVDAGEKVALVGRNGSGKTTLLRIISGIEEADGGLIHLAHGAKIGYLRQDSPVASVGTVLEIAEEGRKHALELKTRLEELERRIESHPTDEELDEYAILHEHFIDAQGYSAERDVRIVLQRLGFDEAEFAKPSSALSGGEKTRLALAVMLLEEPDLLILDEPTNHLDLQATEWLEEWIQSYRGSVLLVSHDRRFLEKVATRFVELRDSKTKSYPGPFEKFIRVRDEDIERQASQAAKLEDEIRKLDEFVRRFINSERVGQARGKRRILNRLIASKTESPLAERSMKANFGKVARSGDIVIECRSLSKSFGNQLLFQDLNWTVRRGERWGVIGQNGAGKSTLVKIALGLMEPDGGSTRLGANVIAGFFSQDASDLDMESTPLEAIAYDTGLQIPATRDLLGKFLFSGDQVFQKIGTLSGGERNKLALARLTALKPNLLVLDEPTNHLDMDSREALSSVLKEYEGTLVLVSHDRRLLEETTSQTLDIRSDGVTQFPGSYADYREHNRSHGKLTATRDHRVQKTTSMSQREISKEIVRWERQIEQLESQIETAENNLRQIEDKLSFPEEFDDIAAISQSYAESRLVLDELIKSWESMSEQLEDLRSLQGSK
jgi:ATP-binding cassette subfamily F protein 3